jgi:hypothetical protein
VSTFGDEPVAVSHTSWRNARKAWTCSACKEPIEVGQKYRYVCFLFDGHWYTFRRCERCQAIYAHLAERMDVEGNGEEFCADALDCGHTYEDRWDEAPPEWLAALAFWRPGDPLPEPPAPQRST